MLVTGLSFPQFLLHLYICSSFRQGQFWMRIFGSRMTTTSLQLMPLSFYWRWTLEVPSSHCRAFYLLRVPYLPGLWYFLEGNQTSHPSRLHFQFIMLVLRTSLLYPTPMTDHVPIYHPPSPTQLSLSICLQWLVIDFFSLPSVIEASPLRILSAF